MIKILTITGPSLSGKTTLARQLVTTGMFTELVSHTTRDPRTGEEHGLDYYFVSDSEFDRTEFAELVEYNGAKYGLSVAEIGKGAAQGKVPILVCDPAGARQIGVEARERGWLHHALFMEIPLETRLRRLVGRIRESDPSLDEANARRIRAIFEQEDRWFDQFDWSLVIAKYDKDNEDEVADLVSAHMS